jgi:phosphatidylserine/phosphatidylglycerophosphate/cardiolipin synthase-like enzyme
MGSAPRKLSERITNTPFSAHAQRKSGVEIRTKHKRAAATHLKSYQIDGRLPRTGAANFSASGLKRQDNDLIVIESTEAAVAFKRNFDARFAGGKVLPIGARRQG